MTPEQQQQFDTMVQHVNELYDWMQQRKTQQISYPLDDASRNSLGVPTKVGTGSHSLTQSVTVPAGGSTFNVPAAYSGSIILLVEGEQVEIPRLS